MDHRDMQAEHFSFTRGRVTVLIDLEECARRTARPHVPVVAMCSVCGASARGEVPSVTAYGPLAELALRVARDRCTERGHHHKPLTHRDRAIQQWYRRQLIRRVLAHSAEKDEPRPDVN
jgi:hypothetical protein